MVTGKSGVFEIAGNPFSGRVTWSETYDIETNTSLISIDSVEVISTNWYGVGYYPKGAVKVNGLTAVRFYSGSGSHNVRIEKQNTYYKIKAGSSGTDSPWSTGEAIVHNMDGTKSINIDVDVALWTTSGNYGSGKGFTGTSTIELTTIPRASTITSASSVVIGNNCRIVWTPMSASFRYKLNLSLGSWSHTTDMLHPNKTEPYTYDSYAIPMEVAKQITNGPKGFVMATLYTYSEGEEQIGNADEEAFVVTVPDNDDTKPTVSMDLSIVSDLASPFNKMYIQDFTKVDADISAEGKYEAEIDLTSRQLVIGNGVYKDPFVTNILTTSGNVTVTAKATDSRGYVGTTEQSIYVIPYGKPALVPADGETSIVCCRCDDNGNIDDSGKYLKIKAKRSYSRVESDGVQYNKCKIRYRCNGGEWHTILAGEADGDEIDIALGGVVTELESAYTIEVGVIDTITENHSFISEPTPVTIIVPSDMVEFNLREGGGGAAFGEYATEDKVLAIAESWSLNVKGKGKLTVGGIPPLYKSDLLNMIYPVGSIYMSVNSTSPGTFLGGTWERIQDRFLLAAGSSYSAGGTGGEATHKLTAAESGSPSHAHSASFSGANFFIRHGSTSGTDTVKAGLYTSVETAVGDEWSNGFSSSSYKHRIDRVNVSGIVTVNSSTATNASQAHNNMPPYLAVYIWKRTA